MAKATKNEAPAATAAETTTTAKSIVNSKYRGKYKGEKDWLAKFLDGEASKTRDVTVSKPNPENPDEKITTTEKRPDGVDVAKLFDVANHNKIDVAKYVGHETDHGFTGRFRMSVRNMLQKVVKQRHGLYNAGGTFTDAPQDFLDKIGAGEKPTHLQDGTKIVVPKPEKAAEPAPATAGA